MSTVSADVRSEKTHLRPSRRPVPAVLHRDVGALFLLRNARAAGALHGRLPDQESAGRHRPTCSDSRDCSTRIEAVYGPLAIQPLASEIYGLYTALVYLTPLFGGMLADRILGQRKTVMIGAVLMAIGHFSDGGGIDVPGRRCCS